MNKKGFAISTVTYVIVLLIVSLLYMLLGIMRNRYTINDDLRNNIIANLNGDEFLNLSDINNCIEEEIMLVDECEEVSIDNLNVTCVLLNNMYEMHISRNICLSNE